MRRTGREEWTRIASLVLVALVAACSLSLGASGTAPRLSAPATTRLHERRASSEAHPVPSTRRVTVNRDVALVVAAVVVAALALIGLIHLVEPRRLALSPALLAVQRGPPSRR